MFSLSKVITLVVFCITPLSFVLAYFIAKASHKRFSEQSAERGELSGLVNEMVSNQKIIKAFGYEHRAEKRFDEINLKLKKSGTMATFFSSLVNPSTRFINSLAYTSVCIAGALLIVNGGAFSIGSLLAVLSYANQYAKPFNEITGVVTELQTAFASARRVFEVLDAKEEPDDSYLPILREVNGNVSISNVSFSYDKSKPLIKSFNLDVTKGQRIAIVGPTGCGKTTFINLLMRFYDLDGGAIYIDNTRHDSVTRASLRQKFGMVLQDTWIFKGSIRDNIAYAKPKASLEDIEDAAKKAHIHGYISRLEKGYDTIISEDSGNLSQGQMQLMCIARVMLALPPMLILDEATSNIDARTEVSIQKAFALMMKGRTSFIIAHRLSTIKEADLILVMKDGKIIEKGTHKELISQEGFYKDLYYSQFEVY